MGWIRLKVLDKTPVRGKVGTHYDRSFRTEDVAMVDHSPSGELRVTLSSGETFFVEGGRAAKLAEVLVLPADPSA